MKTLGELLDDLQNLDDDHTLYAADPWTCHSEAVTAVDGGTSAVAALEDGMQYVVEVVLAREVVQTWSAWRDGRAPTRDEKCAAVIHYATHDAYLEP